MDEILRFIAREVVESEKATALSLACCCKSFEDSMLEALWETQDELPPLLESLPEDVWNVETDRFVSSHQLLLSPV